MAAQAVMDHAELARDFLRRSKSYPESGDLHQASEKGRGAAAHIIKAVAAANSWEYEDHEDFVNVIANARHKYRQPGLPRMSNAAQELHGNYYRRKRFLDAGTIRGDIEDVESMVGVLQPFIQ